MKRSTRLMALLLSVLLLLSMLAACGSTSSSSSEDSSSQSTETEAATTQEAASEETGEEAAEEAPAASEEAAAQEETASEETSEDAVEETATATSIAYPLDGDVTISIWRAFESMMWGGLMEGYGDMPLLPAIMEATGVNVEFVAVNDASSTESFNLMIAGGDWADLIGLDSYTGGASKAYEDGLCYDLADYLDTDMPDYAATLSWLKENYPTAYKTTVTNDGNVLAVYSVYDSYAQEQGLVYRGDWAAECGLDDIVTVDDLNTYLDYVVDTYAPQYAITPSTGGIIDGITSAFGIAGFDASGDSVDLGLYLEGDTVVSSMTSDKFRTYIEWFAEQYARGAVYSDFYSDSYGPDWINSYFADDDVAISYLRSDKISTIEADATSEGYTLKTTADLILEEGSTNTLGDEQTMVMTCFSVMSTTEHLEECLHFLNWFFTDEGYTLSNYGIEDMSFTYDENGEVRFTDLIMESEYSNKVQVRNMYTAMVFPYLKDVDAFFYTYADVEQEAIETWSQGSDASRVPTFDLDSDAAVRYTTLSSDVVAYGATVVLAWMTNAATLDDASWAEYVQTCNQMGLKEAVAIYQEGYDAFMQR